MARVEALWLALEVHDYDVLQGRLGQDGLYARVHVRVDDAGLGAGVVEDVPYLALYVQRVELGDDRPELHGGEKGDDVLWAVREHEGDPVSLFHPGRRERAGEFLYERLQPLELEGRAVERERGLAAVLFGRAPEQLVERALEDLRLRLDVALVDLEPRLLRAEHVSSSFTAVGRFAFLSGFPPHYLTVNDTKAVSEHCTTLQVPLT
jgi:hypothetical protein